MDNRPIGVFDSGVGGLTVVQEIHRRLPHESVVYAGDTARVPYGGKDKATLFTYGREIIHFLTRRHDVKAVVFACGTTSSNVFDELTAAFPGLPLIDVIRPGARAVAESDMRKIGFIATEATIRSGLFARLLREKKPGVHVEARACPLLVFLAEEGWIDHPVTQAVAEVYLDGWRDAGLDAVVLGCTHYPLLARALGDAAGGAPLVNLAEYAVLALRDMLTEKDRLGEGVPRHQFFVSGYADKFDKMAAMTLQGTYSAIKTEWASP